MESGLLLDVIVRKSAAILQLLASKDETLLIWRNTFLILDFCLDVFNGVRWLNLKSDGFSCQGFDKDLHSSSETKYKMESWLLLNVIIRKSAAIFQLLASKDETLLIWRNAFLILNFGLYIFNSVRWFNFKCDGFSSQSFDKNLHASSETEHKMESWFLLDVIIWKSAAILQLFASKDETLLIWRNTFLILDLSFDIFNSIRWLYLKGDSFTSQGFDEDLHTSSETKYKMESWFLLDVVIW